MKYTILIALLIFTTFCTSRRPAGEETADATSTSKPLTVRLTPAWSTAPDQLTCESVIYDAGREVIYVANINGQPREMDGNGFISKLGTDGHVIELKWIGGLHAPKGMAILGDRLFVSDITELVEIDIPGSGIVARYGIEGAAFMNDVAVAGDRIYVSDSDAGAIYVLNAGKLEIWAEGESFDRPNGLWNTGEAMLVGNAGNGTLVEVSFADRGVSTRAEGLGHTDGIAPDGRGNYLVSSWSGQVFFVRSDGSVKKILDTEADKKNCADIDYIPAMQLLIVPTFFGNTVEAYRLEYD
jgi:hypothetical protein